MDDHEHIATLVFLLIVGVSAVHVYRDCKRIGEPASLNVSGTILLWPIFYLIGWLWIWPGSLRRWIFGGSIDDLIQAKVSAAGRNKKRDT